jgi:hypothetical protein
MAWTDAQAINSRSICIIGHSTNSQFRLVQARRLNEDDGDEAARQYGYNQSSAVAMLVKRLEAEAQQRESLRQILQALRKKATSET